MPAASKALVKSGVVAAGASGPAPAPCGEYDVHVGAGALTLSSIDNARVFTLSCDAFCRFVSEGRILIME